MKKFSQVSREEQFSGEKTSIKDLIGKPIEILDFKETKTKFSANCAVVRFRYTGSDEVRIFFTGSKTLMRMLNDYKADLPFETIIKAFPKKDGTFFYAFT